MAYIPFYWSSEYLQFGDQVQCTCMSVIPCLCTCNSVFCGYGDYIEYCVVYKKVMFKLLFYSLDFYQFLRQLRVVPLSLSPLSYVFFQF